MEKIYVSHITEYELGWGQRPDGVALSKSKTALTNYIIERTANQSPEYFWSYSDPLEMVTDSKKLPKLTKRNVIELSTLPKGNWYKNIGT